MFKKLLLADLKMIIRNRHSLFWALFFPLIFTCIFGFFFGKNTTVGSVALINRSQTELANGFKTALTDSEIFKIKEETDEATAKDEVTKGTTSAVVVIPEKFGDFTDPNAPKSIKIIYDPGNSQVNSALIGFVDQFITATSFQMTQTQKIFTIEEEKINTRDLTYFDFVMAGILGLALMNSSIIGIAVGMSKYREDQILKRITTTPLPSWKFIVAEVVSRLCVNMFQISIILLIAVYGFGAHIYGNIFIIYCLAILGAILFQLIGFVIASLSRTTDAAQGMATAITIPMMFLAGVFFPIDQLPKWLSMFVDYLPLAPLLRMIRAVTLDAASPFDNPRNIIIVVSWIFVCLVISTWKFRLSKE
ncbi:MAG: ABC transporter permease [Patescibacteria group bacterium]|jgi:ABC-2 type transport system permease protein